MALWTWWRGDALSGLGSLPGFTVEATFDLDKITGLTALSMAEVHTRLAAGHRIYVAAIDGTPAAYGWVATLLAEIGELSLRFEVPSTDRYLWDFVTLPAWRGRGIYPRLLQAILAYESPAAERFWIIHAPENVASASGIRKAGFQMVSELSFMPEVGVGSRSMKADDRSQIGVRLLGVPLIEIEENDGTLSPCWRCFMDAHVDVRSEHECCGCSERGADHACTCASPARTNAPVGTITTY